MSDVDFEGTLVLERFAAIGRLDEFSEAIDSEDVRRVAGLMRAADIDEETIALVLAEMGVEDAEL